MARLGGGGGPVTALNAQALRLVGLAAVVLSTGFVALSVATPYGFEPASGSDPATAQVAADPGAVSAVVAFAVAHPAYPALALVGLVLLVLGDDAPLA